MKQPKSLARSTLWLRGKVVWVSNQSANRNVFGQLIVEGILGIILLLTLVNMKPLALHPYRNCLIHHIEESLAWYPLSSCALLIFGGMEAQHSVIISPVSFAVLRCILQPKLPGPCPSIFYHLWSKYVVKERLGFWLMKKLKIKCRFMMGHELLFSAWKTLHACAPLPQLNSFSASLLTGQTIYCTATDLCCWTHNKTRGHSGWTPGSFLKS